MYIYFMHPVTTAAVIKMTDEAKLNCWTETDSWYF